MIWNKLQKILFLRSVRSPNLERSPKNHVFFTLLEKNLMLIFFHCFCGSELRDHMPHLFCLSDLPRNDFESPAGGSQLWARGTASLWRIFTIKIIDPCPLTKFQHGLFKAKSKNFTYSPSWGTRPPASNSKWSSPI